MSRINQLLVLAGAALALTACGGGGSTTTTTPAAAASATVSTSLSAATVTVGNTVDLTVTIANTGSSAVSGGALTIPLPAGSKSLHAVSIAAPCAATSLSAGNSGFILSGLSVPAGATCTNTNIITLTPSTAGTHLFTPTGLTSVTAGTTATLTIN